MIEQGTVSPNPKVVALEPKKAKKVTKCFYLVEVIFVIVALGLYVGIYFINLIPTAPGIISPYYDGSSSTISTLVVGSATVTQPSFSVGTIIKTLTFNWIMWKVANIIVLLDMLAPLSWRRKLVGISVFGVIMCALDWTIFILLNKYSYDYAFVGISWVITFLVSITLFANQEKQRFHVTFRNSLFAYLSYSVLIAVYWFGIPSLFNVLIKNLTGITGTLAFFYIFPIIDLLLVLFGWLMQYAVSDNMKMFVSVATNWLSQGYRVGILCRLSFAETDFYYQIAWIMFRNVLFSWVTNNQHLNRVNLSHLGWIVAYYISIFFNFLPICGVSNVITSNSYSASISLFSPYLLPNNPYTTTITSSATLLPTNLSMLGNIQWYGPLIIWGIDTFTQRYKLYEFNWKLIIYNLFGIYLFYLGLISGLGIY